MNKAQWYRKRVKTRQIMRRCIAANVKPPRWVVSFLVATGDAHLVDLPPLTPASSLLDVLHHAALAQPPFHIPLPPKGRVCYPKRI